jgi:YjbE family integral membrane protein
MEIFSPEFFAALAAIIVIDLVLAGDNAIVIALAARNLPERLRRRAILWGTAGAIGVRAAMTAVVVWLLKIPGLMFAAGLMLLWIAYRLLVPADGGEGNGHADKAASSFWGAMGTIVVADAMMGLDNVLAVAGAAHGSYLLVVLGLLISIPIVVWGSRLVLQLIDRFPAIVYIGATVLAFTAAKMITDEPSVKVALENRTGLLYASYAALTLGVIVLAWLRTQFRRQDRLQAHLVDSAVQQGDPGVSAGKVLVPIDGSRRSLEALHLLARRCSPHAMPEVHLLNVQHPLSRHIASFLGRGGVAAWQQQQGEKALKKACELLARLGLSYARHVRVGARAQTIADTARELGCQRIVMASARRNSLTRLLDDSVTQRLLEHAPVPIEVIVTPHRSRIEFYGLAASMAVLAVFAGLLLQ